MEGFKPQIDQRLLAEKARLEKEITEKMRAIFLERQKSQPDEAFLTTAESDLTILRRMQVTNQEEISGVR